MDETPALNLSHLAIEAALSARWEDALKLNKKIIKNDPLNVDALSRLARVYMELGRCNLAKKYYSEVIKIDPYNPIALKNLKIIKSFKPSRLKDDQSNLNGSGILSASLFLQEPGKTKIVNLLKVAEPQKLSKAYCGMKVMIIMKNRKIAIIDNNKNYLGVLPDDINHHLVRLIRGGNKYDFYIKSIRVNGLAILIKETYRSKRFKNQSSFLESSNTLRPTEIIRPFGNHDSEQSSSSNEQSSSSNEQSSSSNKENSEDTGEESIL